MKPIIKPLLQRTVYSKEGAYPAGHYYSPIPDKEEMLAYINSAKPPPKDLPGIDLKGEAQLKLLNEFVPFYKELPFPEKQNAECRFYYENPFFSYSDAIFLYSFLRKQQPKRIVEIGSGFSSAVILDTVDRFFPRRPEIAFVEPYPDRLKTLLRGNDASQVKIIEKKVQEAPSEIFSSLQSGDLLFIDSSHVVKCGSDLQFLMCEIIPSLPAGIFVHFHDIFYPFEYPVEWLKEGRYWNENYFLRAFLSYNSEWSIYFFNTYVAMFFGDFIKDKLPLCRKNAGGSLYIRREKASA